MHEYRSDVLIQMKSGIMEGNVSLLHWHIILITKKISLMRTHPGPALSVLKVVEVTEIQDT